MRTIYTKELIQELRRQNFDVRQTSQGHWRVCPPGPTLPIVHMGNGSHDPRAMRNNLIQLKGSGFVPPWEKDAVQTEEEMKQQTMDLDYLNQVLDIYGEVKKLPVDQILFTRENDGKWLMSIVEGTHIVAEGVLGKGLTPTESCNKILNDVKSELREHIKRLQELEARLEE